MGRKQHNSNSKGGAKIERQLEEDGVDEKGRSALSLFGGRNAVIDRITETVCEKLQGNDHCEYTNKEIEKYLNLRRGLLKQIKQKQKKADIDLFEKLEGPLDLPSIYDILGAPDFNRPSRREWREEHGRSPMYVVARGGGRHRGVIPEKPIKLELYVKLRAIGELHRTTPTMGH